ncbi:tRNA (uridine(34)/cytosine(34)/5-carboxymethylaminomethyluridine(34)-2'-O)-methyltransferase TrmL [Youngiibacter multivorans]|uniref:Putative tRNA (cytidine(34)-2'-O)-methyltransferase n=1 Tax=Youngiibacter multivorans TaxID=937251 RepID=A0ABS4G5D1_9CLOT|nr:tRNA (uridine(34)/cytosine(34)/5-carboxymethylaminomethyluridine(34)-2'-O)-methyltransferase TrmL [Youngiibacter multivorans]MBP1919756.1 tRNA (cytidine/uridine-2'-O-)-methyltransferase [Youngiibacter multivorans]
MLNVVLFNPEIPQNTGNIGRTCVLTDSRLHIIRPTGFEITDKNVRRAGLDYWPFLELHMYDSFDELMEKYRDARFFFSTTKGSVPYTEVEYRDEDFIVFGKESSGLPDSIRDGGYGTNIRVPMIESSTRSLNLSNTVAIVVYEAKRQTGFKGMK